MGWIGVLMGLRVLHRGFEGFMGVFEEIRAPGGNMHEIWNFGQKSIKILDKVQVF